MPYSFKFAPLVVFSGIPSSPDNWKVFSEKLQDVLNDVRLTVFASGKFLTAWFRIRPQDTLWIREQIRHGRLEFLGGTFDDVLLPLFPRKMIQMEIDRHRKVLEKYFFSEPVGYFNSSMVWEIGMTSLLSQSNFAYTLVEDSALAEALGRITRVSGWFSTENNARLMRLLPVDTALSTAFKKDAETFWQEVSKLPQNNKTWIVRIDSSVENEELTQNTFSHIREILKKENVLTWTLSHIVENQPTDGRVNLLSCVGKTLGLPPTAKSCRELLLRRPEIHFLHKAWLATLRRAEANLTEKEFLEIVEILMPIMAPRYYADLGDNEGFRTPSLRRQAHREILRAGTAMDAVLKTLSMRMELTDYLLLGEQQLWVENEKLSFLLEPARGGILRALNIKENHVNLLTAFRDDGYVAAGFSDYILPQSLTQADALNSALEERTGILESAYDLVIERENAKSILKMSGEQVLPIEDKSFLFYVEKSYTVSNQKSVFDITYKISKMTYQEYAGFFGSEIEVGALETTIVLNGKKETLPTSSVLFKNIRRLEYGTKILGAQMRFDFSESVSCLVSPIFGSEKLASPCTVQGARLFFFKPIVLKDSESFETLNVRLSLNTPRLFS